MSRRPTLRPRPPRRVLADELRSPATVAGPVPFDRAWLMRRLRRVDWYDDQERELELERRRSGWRRS